MPLNIFCLVIMHPLTGSVMVLSFDFFIFLFPVCLFVCFYFLSKQVGLRFERNRSNILDIYL